MNWTTSDNAMGCYAGSCMGETFVQGEPDITDVGVEQWQAWFTGLDTEDKMAWATAKKGSEVTTKAAALGIAREYAMSAGFEPQDVFSPYGYYQMQETAKRQARNSLLLVAGGAVLVGWMIFGRRGR